MDMMYYFIQNGVKRPITAPVFWALFIITLTVIFALAAAVVIAFGWLVLFITLVLTITVTTEDGRELAVVENESVRRVISWAVVLASIVVLVIK